MKTINATFEDKEFKQIERVKTYEGLTWEDFISLGSVLIKERRERIREHHEEEAEVGTL